MDTPKYEQLKTRLTRQIQGGRYNTGDKIPSQAALARRWEISRITVRRATGDLIREGILEHLAGRKGLFVAPPAAGVPGARTIAVAIDDVTERFGSTILRGIEDYLWQERYHTIICNSDRDFGKVEAYFASFDDNKVDGVIFAPVIDVGFHKRNARIAGLIERKSIPLVVVDRYIDGVRASSVTTNHRESACDLTKTLIRSGHRRILLGRGIDCSSVAEREAGYRDAYGEAGMEPAEALILRVNDNRLHPEPLRDEIANMKGQIRAAGEFTAFYAMNNRILRAGIRSMRELGIDLGSMQFALHSEVSKPIPRFSGRLPRVLPPLYRMGWMAARLLLETISDSENVLTRIVLTSEINYENLAAATAPPSAARQGNREACR